MLNKVVLMGRLTRNTELKYTNSGVATLSNCVAVERNYSGKNGERETDFINVQAWRKTAEFISKWFEKGQMIVVIGSIQTNRYTDKNGAERVSTVVVADEVSFAGEKKRENQGGFTEFEDDGDEIPF